MTTLYGIKNCDTVKKARHWLEEHQIDYRFHDFRADGLNKIQVQTWIDDLGWESLINKRSATWKQLSEVTKKSLTDKTATATILANPTLIKRPLLELDGKRHLGFKDSEYEQLFIK